MIKCYLCPLNGVCPVVKITEESSFLPLKLDWLPDGAEDQCPLFITAREHDKRFEETKKPKR